MGLCLLTLVGQIRGYNGFVFIINISGLKGENDGEENDGWDEDDGENDGEEDGGEKEDGGEEEDGGE